MTYAMFLTMLENAVQAAKRDDELGHYDQDVERAIARAGGWFAEQGIELTDANLDAALFGVWLMHSAVHGSHLHRHVKAGVTQVSTALACDLYLTALALAAAASEVVS